MLVYGLTLNQDVLELCLVQLVNCWKIRKNEYQEFFFFEKITSFACLVGSGLNDIFQLKAQSRILTKSLVSLEGETLVLLTTEKREVSSANSLTLVVRPRGRSLM